MASNKQPKPAWTTVTVRPLSGALDTRTQPEEVAIGSWRWKQNMRLTSGTRLCRREGFEKAFNSSAYVNGDLHDQGYVNGAAVTAVTPEHITMLFEAEDNTGHHYLYGGTLNRLYLYDESAGTWANILALNQTEEVGTSQQRFKAAELQQVILFTDNVNPIYNTAVGGLTVAPVPELQSLGVTAAGVVIQFAGFMLLMDVNESAVGRTSSRILWSDFNGPTRWTPGALVGNPPTTSLANFQDLDYGAQILNAVEVSGSLWIYTTESIWRCSPTGDTNVFSFTKVYTDTKNRSKCLVYPNTLVSVGTQMYYASQEAIYYFDPFIPEPTREEWLYRGAALMFSDQYTTDPNCCQSPVAEVVPEETEIYFSWPELAQGSNCTNTKTLVINYMYSSVDIYDHGFSVFRNFRPAQAAGPGCNTVTQYFLAASCQDLCLKNIGVGFSREICTNPGGTGTLQNGVYVPTGGTYQLTGYYSILRTLLPFQNFNLDKWIRKLLLECHPNVTPFPNCVMRLRVGNSFSESDPNQADGKCSVLWHQMKDQPLVCLDTQTNVQYVAANVRRNSGTEWNFLQAGRFLYVEFMIANVDGSAALGGDCCFSRMELETQLQTS
jgi:hypothetical protein